MAGAAYVINNQQVHGWKIFPRISAANLVSLPVKSCKKDRKFLKGMRKRYFGGQRLGKPKLPACDLSAISEENGSDRALSRLVHEDVIDDEEYVPGPNYYVTYATVCSFH